MNDPRIGGASLPEPGPYGALKCIRPYAGYELDITILGETMVGVITHWMVPAEHPPLGRSVLCGRDDCNWCRLGRKIRWVGYLAVWDHRLSGTRALVLGRESALQIVQAFPAPSRLRGQRILVTRSGRDTWGPVGIKRTDRRPLTPLVAAPGLLPTLVAMYGRPVLAQLDAIRSEEG